LLAKLGVVGLELLDALLEILLLAFRFARCACGVAGQAQFVRKSA
jgi:hypothetical protein